MNTLNILLYEYFPEFLNLVFILALLRLYIGAGLLLVLILAKRIWYDSTVIDSNTDDRISLYNTTEVNFNKFLTGFSKPFSLNKVY
jgi:hypothetical protein